MKTTVIHHSADFDGLFCREIARKFLPEAELIGWDFGDAPLPSELPIQHQVFVLDLPLDRPFGLSGSTAILTACHSKTVWIDHHKSSIETHPASIPGYRIDGVAACRLAWQWFKSMPEHATPNFAGRGVEETLPSKQDFIDRTVSEPLAVLLAGEYDIFDKRDPRAELFQFALRTCEVDYQRLLRDTADSLEYISALGEGGKVLQYARTQENESVIKHNGFSVQFEGLTFLACNHARFNSQLFTAGIKPEHEALLGFRWDGKQWNVSLYNAPGKEHHDLSLIAVKHGGGGHKGACGFRAAKLPFLP